MPEGKACVKAQAVKPDTLDTDPTHCVRGPCLPFAQASSGLRGLSLALAPRLEGVSHGHSRSLPPTGTHTGQFSPSLPLIKQFSESSRRLSAD